MLYSITICDRQLSVSYPCKHTIAVLKAGMCIINQAILYAVIDCYSVVYTTRYLQTVYIPKVPCSLEQLLQQPYNKILLNLLIIKT